MQLTHVQVVKKCQGYLSKNVKLEFDKIEKVLY